MRAQTEGYLPNIYGEPTRSNSFNNENDFLLYQNTIQKVFQMIKVMTKAITLVGVTTSDLLGQSLTGTKDLLVSVLLLLSLLSRSLLDLLSQTVSDQSVGWLELLGLGNGVVDQTETDGLTTTELGSEAKDRNRVLVSLVSLGQSLTQLILRDVGSVWVQDVDDKLLSSQQWVGDDLSGADSDSVRLGAKVSITSFG